MIRQILCLLLVLCSPLSCAAFTEDNIEEIPLIDESLNQFASDCEAYISGVEEDVTVVNNEMLAYDAEVEEEIPTDLTVFETREDEDKEVPTDEIETVEMVDNSENTDIIDDNEEILFGDVNGDGKITSGDLVTLKDLILGKVEATKEMVLAADINGDGEISSGDLISLKLLLTQNESNMQ